MLLYVICITVDIFCDRGSVWKDQHVIVFHFHVDHQSQSSSKCSMNWPKWCPNYNLNFCVFCILFSLSSRSYKLLNMYSFLTICFDQFYYLSGVQSLWLKNTGLTLLPKWNSEIEHANIELHVPLYHYVFVSFAGPFQSWTWGVDCAVVFCRTSEDQFVKVSERYLWWVRLCLLASLKSFFERLWGVLVGRCVLVMTSGSTISISVSIIMDRALGL